MILITDSNCPCAYDSINTFDDRATTMFTHIDFRHTQQTVYFFRGVARLLGFRRHARPVVFRIPPSAR